MKTSHAFLLALSLLVTPCITYAQEAPPYIGADALSASLLTPPPAPGSDAWKKDIETILALQAKADKAEVEKAAAERKMKPDLMTLAVDPALTREAYPALYLLLDRTDATSYVITGKIKDAWNTKRPYLSDTRVKALIEAHDNPSYPSGHTSDSYLLAQVLAQLIPAKRAQFFARANEIAQHRVLVGMHYPHDVAGGRELALLMTGALMQNPEFTKDFDAAKKETGSKNAHAE